ncbi:pseudouridine synthase [Candidatus Accumulibacter aalborgensis]|uniref:pseudouridine synthase n=1 Tax=Candidatus Accumulibacter aalborgensis TaxID=1860102 RepID=UPI001645DE2B|nr:S4 domain-containing protein [Candidatus Accumulibacter aalborgensis]
MATKPAQSFRKDTANTTGSSGSQLDRAVPLASAERKNSADRPPPAADRGTPAGGERARIDRPGKPARVHPPRGIARSTGVRAAPPDRQAADRDERPPTDRQASVPSTAACQEAVETPHGETSTTPPGPQRGLPKESPRLSKLVSQLAQCSRREADEWIENGWVSVDGTVVNRLGARVNPKATVEIKDAASKHQIESVTIVFNKPLDPATPADEGLETAATLIRPDTRWAEDGATGTFQAAHLRGLALAGKLDAEEHGMLVFTQEGSVARRLTGGGARLEKEYHLHVEGDLVADGLDLLRHGLSLDNVKLERAQVSWLSEQQLRFVVHENRKRQIQRGCELVGLRVTDIKRVRIGGVSLGKLPPGQWRYLRPDERF